MGDTVWSSISKTLGTENKRRRASTAGKEISVRAVKQIGSPRWVKESDYRDMTGQKKSHVFVADVLEESGATVPHRWPRFLKWSPIEPAEWCNRRSKILQDDDNWCRVTYPRAGDVAAGDGHVAIVTSIEPGLTVGTSGGRVITTDWGFRPAQKMLYWRYEGPYSK